MAGRKQDKEFYVNEEEVKNVFENEQENIEQEPVKEEVKEIKHEEENKNSVLEEKNEHKANENKKYIVLRRKGNVGNISININKKAVNATRYKVIVCDEVIIKNNAILLNYFSKVGDTSNFSIDTEVKKPVVLLFASGCGSFTFCKNNDKNMNNVKCGRGLMIASADYSLIENKILRDRTLLLANSKDCLIIK